MVLFIIAILMGITIGVVFGVRQRARTSQARTELAAIASVLEQFKMQFGDYPQTGAFGPAGPTTTEEGGSAIAVANTESKLVNALMGVLGPKMTTVATQIAGGGEQIGRTFLDAGAFAFEIVDDNEEPVLPTQARTEVSTSSNPG